MFGVEVPAFRMEDPFGNDPDDLDLEGICEGIRNSVMESARY